ncbi:MAG: Sialic acid-binding periplasmic protein SiaP precursor [Syntrophorhabdaceae bacterium PtaU1.Bin034]|nr:MAG: Sialic acid-binding periplasmic protein SiaP precursor [Syntrophorhabdaceae bacterium PtaU1.Bin034]
MRRSGFNCIMWFLVVSVFFILAGQLYAAEDKVIRLKYANFWPPLNNLSKLSEQWCKEVEKKTNGKVKINYLPGGTLVPANQSYEGAVRGITDISVTATQWTAGRFPMSELVHLPIGLKSSAQATKLINAWYKKFKPKEFDDVKVLYLFCSGPDFFMTVKPLPSIHDLKGKKIRAAGETSKTAAAMGAVPVSVPIGDAYEAFQRGVAEGVLLAREGLKSFRWGDLLKGMQVNDGIGSVSALAVVMNKNKWNSLPPDVQRVMEQVSEEWADKVGKTWDETDKEAVDFAVSKGMKITTISKEEVAETRKMVKPLLDAYVARTKKLGLPGEESLKFAFDFLKSNP